MSTKMLSALTQRTLSQTIHYRIPNKVRKLCFVGKANNGLVKATLWGSGRLEKIEFDKSLKEEKTEVLETLVKEAYSDAREQILKAAEKILKDANEKLENEIVYAFTQPEPKSAFDREAYQVAYEEAEEKLMERVEARMAKAKSENKAEEEDE